MPVPFAPMPTLDLAVLAEHLEVGRPSPLVAIPDDRDGTGSRPRLPRATAPDWEARGASERWRGIAEVLAERVRALEHELAAATRRAGPARSEGGRTGPARARVEPPPFAFGAAARARRVLATGTADTASG